MEESGKGRRIALLSNVNMNALIRMLQKDAEVYEAEGYGNELGVLMNPSSSYHAFQPEITFLVIDLMELLEHDTDLQGAKGRVENWFASFENAINPSCTYYVSDAYLWAVELEAAGILANRAGLEGIWQERLNALCKNHGNIRILPYHDMIAGMGEENAFSLKMWYMGKILLGGECQKRLAALILHKVSLEGRTPKKVLALDLDNTLWGGLAGEHEHTPILLSEEHGGLAYKNLQRVILYMQRQGVLLAIVSKNNKEDAEELIQNHPHMVLRLEHFAAKRIHWGSKDESLTEIAEELNLGLDSFVFWDDRPEERLLIRSGLPQVTVPDFPSKLEELAPAMIRIYHEYFEKSVLTEEDLEKTKQYAANAERTKMQRAAGSFEDYLRQLRITVTEVDAGSHIKRLEALLNKTNQFNLTTKRHGGNELQSMLADKEKRVYLYRVEDCFGDNGVVAAVIADVSGKTPTIEEFVMSCRVMGRNIEQGILTHVESALRKEGFERIRGIYIPTAKNKPVENLYTQAGYTKISRHGEDAIYELSLQDTPHRTFIGNMQTIKNKNSLGTETPGRICSWKN